MDVDAIAGDPGLCDVLTAMDAQAIVALLAACAPSVHPATALSLIEVESAFNPHAIGVVAGVLERQPRSRAEALVTARSLAAQNIDFSVGLAQINARNLARLGLSLEQAFDPCQNVAAMANLLAQCLDRAGGSTPQVRIRRALSCYYSGDFSTGFRHGYVSRVAAAAKRSAGRAPRPPP